MRSPRKFTDKTKLLVRRFFGDKCVVHEDHDYHDIHHLDEKRDPDFVNRWENGVPLCSNCNQAIEANRKGARGLPAELIQDGLRAKARDHFERSRMALAYACSRLGYFLYLPDRKVHNDPNTSFQFASQALGALGFVGTEGAELLADTVRRNLLTLVQVHEKNLSSNSLAELSLSIGRIYSRANNRLKATEWFDISRRLNELAENSPRIVWLRERIKAFQEVTSNLDPNRSYQNLFEGRNEPEALAARCIYQVRADANAGRLDDADIRLESAREQKLIPKDLQHYSIGGPKAIVGEPARIEIILSWCDVEVKKGRISLIEDVVVGIHQQCRNLKMVPNPDHSAVQWLRQRDRREPNKLWLPESVFDTLPNAFSEATEKLYSTLGQIVERRSRRTVWVPGTNFDCGEGV